MRKQIWFLTLLTLLLLMVLSACRSSPTPTQEPVTTNPPPTIAMPAASPTIDQPSVVQNAVSAYPAPTVEIVLATPYPPPFEGETIEWSQVPDLLASGNVSEVRQKTTLEILITLKDGGQVLTTAPAKDEIFKLLDQCGETCNEIRRLSEW